MNGWKYLKNNQSKLAQPHPILKYVYTKMTQEEYSPYCPICEACGEEGCCSAMACQQDPNGHYCKGYLQDLKFGYAMNRFIEREIVEHLPDELKDKYNKEWNEAYDAFYKIEE